MSNNFKKTASQENPKLKWVRPDLRKIKAGSAEVGSGTLDDADPGVALNNS